MRRIFSLLALSALALTACGGSDETAEAGPAPVETEAAPVETEAPAETEVPASTEAPAETTATETTASAGAVQVGLEEWAVEAPVDLTAGIVTFNVSNGGSFPHHFGIARGNSYEELPLADDGAIDEAALGDDYLGRTANLQSGATETIDYDLEPGNYVLFCNIASTVSHAAQGQVLSVTVA